MKIFFKDYSSSVYFLKLLIVSVLTHYLRSIVIFFILDCCKFSLLFFLLCEAVWNII